MLVTLFVAWSIYLFQNKKWVLFSISLILVGMTDYLGLLIIPVFWLLGKDWKKLFFSHIPLAVTFLIYSPIFVRQLLAGSSVEGSNWWNILGTLSPKNLALIPVKFILGRISFDNDILYGLISVLSFGLVVYLVLKVKKINKLYLYWLVAPIFLGIIISLKVPVLHYFRFIFCVPALYILIAQSSAKKMYVYIFVFLNILASSYYLLNSNFHREDWRSASKSIANNQIVMPADSQKEALTYYSKDTQIVKVPTEKIVWLSRYVWEIFDPTDSTRLQLEKLGYNKASEYNFNGVAFYKYENRN
jgi:hypothetical protein